MADSAPMASSASPLPQLPPTRDRRVARWVSHIASPPVLAVGGSVMTAAQISSIAAWLWALFSISISVLLPTLVILIMVRRGKLTDFDIFVREQRYWPYLLSISATALSWLVMLIGRAPQIFLVIGAAAAGQTLLMFLVNLRWKISVHASGTACFAILTWHLFGPAGATVLLAIPLVAWSRVRLGRHTVGQVTAGAALGAGLLFTIFRLFV